MAEHKHYQAREFNWNQFEADKKKKAKEEAERRAAAEQAPLELTEAQCEGLRLAGLDDPAQIDRLIGQSIIVARGIKAVRRLFGS